MKTQHKKTVADLEKELGVTDTICNPSGSNAYGNQHVATLEKKLLKLLPGMSLPDKPVTGILIQFSDGQKVSISASDLQKAGTVLHALGLI